MSTSRQPPGSLPAFSPGPWVLDPVAGAAGSSYVYSEPDSSALIARVDARECGEAVAKANAQLIAAAPELAAALKAACRVLKDGSMGDAQAVYQNAVAALAKAGL